MAAEVAVLTDDVSRAFIAVARYAGPHRTMNVGSGRGRSLNQLVAGVGAMLDTALIRPATGWWPGVEWLDGLAGTAAWIRGAFGL